MTEAISSIRKDFIASHLRFQIDRLRSILSNIEAEERVDCGYATESLKQIEVNLRQIRRLCLSN